MNFQKWLQTGLGLRACSTLARAELRGGISEVPSGRTFPFLGTLPQLLAAGGPSRLHEYIDRRHRQLGPIFRERVGPIDAIFLCEPDDMRAVFSPRAEGRRPRHVLPPAWLLHKKESKGERGLFFMDGDEWWHYRRLMNKLLLGSDMKWLRAPLESCLENLVANWGENFKTGDSKEIDDLENQLYRLSIDVIVAALLGSSYEKSRQQLEPILRQFSQVVHEIFLHSATLSVMPPEIASRLNLPPWRKFVEAWDTSLNLGNELVDKILDKCPAGDGLISGMLAEQMSREDIKRIVADLVIAAGDTTAFTTQWALVLLAKHKSQQEALRKESVSGERMLAKGVLRETLRLYPVATFITRFLAEDTMFGGYLIPAETLMICSLYTSGRDPDSFSRPNEFVPERWCRSDSRTLNGNHEGLLRAHASIPFALGTRSCVGQRIANMQIQETLIKLMKNFKIECMNIENIEMVMRMVAVPSEPIKLKITKL